MGVKNIWIRKNIKKNKKYRLAFDKKRGWGKKKKKKKKTKTGKKKKKKKKTKTGSFFLVKMIKKSPKNVGEEKRRRRKRKPRLEKRRRRKRKPRLEVFFWSKWSKKALNDKKPHFSPHLHGNLPKIEKKYLKSGWGWLNRSYQQCFSVDVQYWIWVSPLVPKKRLKLTQNDQK